MKLDEAITHVRAILSATPGAAETYFIRDAVRALLQQAEQDRTELRASLNRVQAAAGGPRRYKPDVDTTRRLAAALRCSPSFAASQLLGFDWGCDAPAETPTPTLRDQFATAAMQAAATNSTGFDVFEQHQQRAQWAYQQADAMLAARGAR